MATRDFGIHHYSEDRGNPVPFNDFRLCGAVSIGGGTRRPKFRAGPEPARVAVPGAPVLWAAAPDERQETSSPRASLSGGGRSARRYDEATFANRVCL